MQSIDLNCDLGETWNEPEELYRYITSSNICCGVHAGDPLLIKTSIQRALKHNVQIGAHPGYPDRENFGRLPMELSLDELRALLEYQIGALKVMTEMEGGKVRYVKPHGALYHLFTHEPEKAGPLLQTIKKIDNNLAFMGMAQSPLEVLCQDQHIPFIPEGFADRQYDSVTALTSRKKPEALIEEPEAAVQQVDRLIHRKEVISSTGETLPVSVKSICVHGDTPAALAILKAIHGYTQQKGIQITSV